MPEKKNQHFVPQFYLKNFSIENNQTTIGIYVKEKEHFFLGASISDQASKDYFYGKDLTYEDLLGKIESKARPVINDIIENKELPDHKSDDHLILISFICLMCLRTLIAREMINEAWDKSLIQIFRDEKLIPDEFKVSDNTSGFLVQLAIENIPILKDLKLKILVNYTSKPFITSDHPAVKYNQLFEPKNTAGGSTGFGSMGLQIFLPISPSLQLIAYDDNFYEVGVESQSLVEVNKIKDVNALNSLQIINSGSTVYFNEKMTQQHLDYLKSTNEEHFMSERSTVNEYPSLDSDNKSLLHWYPNEIQCDLALRFIKLSKDGLNFELDDRVIYPRDFEFVEELRRQIRLMKEGKIEILPYIKTLLS